MMSLPIAAGPLSPPVFRLEKELAVSEINIEEKTPAELPCSKEFTIANAKAGDDFLEMEISYNGLEEPGIKAYSDMASFGNDPMEVNLYLIRELAPLDEDVLSRRILRISLKEHLSFQPDVKINILTKGEAGKDILLLSCLYKLT